MKKYKVVFFLICLLLITYFLQPVYAADSTQSAQSSSPSAAIKSKIDALKKEIASRAAQFKSEVTKKLENKAFTGSINEISSSKLTLASSEFKRVVLVNDYTVFQNDVTPVKKGAKPKSLTLDDLQKDDFVVALGDVDDKNELNAKKIIKIKKFAPVQKEVVWGQIQDLLGNTMTVKTKDNQKKTIVSSGQTTFYLGNEESSLKDAKAGKFLVASGAKGKDGETIVANHIYLIPSLGFIKPEKKAASISATP